MSEDAKDALLTAKDAKGALLTAKDAKGALLTAKDAKGALLTAKDAKGALLTAKGGLQRLLRVLQKCEKKNALQSCYSVPAPLAATIESFLPRPTATASRSSTDSRAVFSFAAPGV
jgi:hypothetical protein